MSENITNLNWIGRTCNHGAKADVSVTIANQSESRRCVNVTFRNSVNELVTQTDYMVVAPFKNRLFFKSATDVNGLLLCKNANSPNRYIRINRESDVESLTKFAGNYDLKYDEFYELYYIEKKGEEL
mgnify:CR=1 FL=1